MTPMPDFKPDTSRANHPALPDSSLSSGGVSRPEELSPQSTDCPRIGVTRIICFFLLVGVIAVLLNLAINSGLRRITVSKFGSLNQVMAGKVNADIIISGSSRALNHYDPRIIQNLTGMSAYNIGMNASQIDLELVVLKTYLEYNTKPDLVIQNLDLFSFEITKKGELYDPGYYIPYLYDRNIYDFYRQMMPDAWKCKYIPLYGYAVEDMRFTWIWGLLSWFGIQGHQDFYQGFNPRAAIWNNDFQNFKADNASGVRYALNPKGVKCLEEIIDLCHRNSIEIILVYSPEYHEVQRLEANRKDIMGKFEEIARHFNVPFWDYSDSAISMQQSYFNNSEHLNAEGAQVFSDDLARRLSKEMSQLKATAAGKTTATNRPIAQE
jgi:hypothetical protein